MTEPVDIDPRFLKATEHAGEIRAAARALTNAIYAARRDGYDAVVRVENGAEVSPRRFVTHGEAINVTASIAFDIGGAI